jgi:tetratricopeptide (TPR) repeat protein
MRRRSAFAWAAALALSAAPAAAVDPQPTNSTELARQRFREATEAYRDGRYSAAASLFDAADRLTPHPSTRYNAAAAWEKAGEAARAATGYEAALAAATLDEPRRKVAEARLASLKQGLGKIRVQRPLGAFVTVDHVQRLPVPNTFYLLPGTYELAVDFQGKTSQSALEVVAGQDHDVKLDFPEPSPPVTAPKAALEPVRLPPIPPQDTGISQETWGWIGVGAGVALSGAAIVLGANALSARDEFVESGNTDAGAHDQAQNLRLATNVVWGGAAAAGIAGLVLVLTAPTFEF